jgi:hypothetical protein
MSRSCIGRIILGLICAGLLLSQEFRATISGRVQDPSSAAVPGVTVTVVNVDTNIKTETKTLADGTYVIPFLRPGNYSLSVEAPGFKKYVQTGIILEVAQKAGFDVPLQVGSQAEQIEVSAATQLLETESASRSTDFTPQQVQELPLNYRNPYTLMADMPGVQFRGNLTWIRPFDGGAAVAWSMNGGLVQYNEILLDGAPNTAFGDSGSSVYGYVPSTDAVSEVKGQTSTYDAQYGRTTGGVSNVMIKTGSNLLHGSVYEFYRRNFLDANTFFNNSVGAAKPSHLLDQYGYELDGPVYIPKIYNGKNRTFFTSTFERIHEKSPAAIVQSTPSPELLTGDFSKYTNANGVQIPIYDPLNGFTDPTAPSQWTRVQFPGNKIPPNRISKVALNVLSFMPPPNCTTANSSYSSNNWCNPANSDEDKYWNVLAKVDHNINEKNHVFFRYGGYNRSEHRPFNGIEGVGESGQQPYYRISNSAGGDWVYTITPTLIANVRATYTRLIEWGFGTANKGFDPVGKLGLPASLLNGLPGGAAHDFNVWTVGGLMQLGRGDVRNLDNDYALNGSITKIWRGHNIHTGFDLRQYNYLIQSTSTNASGTNGVLNISSGSGFTQKWYAQGDNSGSGIASFLLGDVSGNIAIPVFPWMKQLYGSLFVQDDWKVTSRLTLNLGLRWDATMPITEKHNRLNIGLDTTTTSPLASLVNPALFPYGNAALKGGIMFAGVNGNSDGSFNSDYNNFAPRIGAAYRLSDKLVARGGYGMYYFNLNIYSYRLFNGYSQSTSLSNSIDGGKTPVTTANGGILDNPQYLFPTGWTPPTGNSQGLNTFVGQGISMPQRNVRTPRTDQLSAGLEYSVSKQSVLEVTYGGSRGYHLAMNGYFNLPSPALRAQCDYLEGGSPNFCNANITNPFLGLQPFLTSGSSWYTATTLQRFQLMRPLPQFNGDTTEVNNTIGKSWYNSLQVNYRWRTRSGLSLLSGYTFSKWMQRTGYDDNITGRLQTVMSGNDQKHVFKLSAAYELPIGKGKKFFNAAGFVNRVFGGWEANTNFQSASGSPVNLPTTAFMLKNTFANSVDWQQFKVRLWDPCTIQILATGAQSIQGGGACTSSNATWEYLPAYTPNIESSITTLFRMPRMTTMDASLNKSFQIKERLRAQFRVEGFNVLNHAIFGGNLNTNPADSNGNFGTWTRNSNVQGFPRQLQLALKILW